MSKALEHSEHISHAGHGDGDHGKGPPERLGMFVGITMATLGVLLAFCAAKVGGERTELVQSLVEQQNAHQEWLGSDVKHRVAFISLLGLHATTPEANVASLNKDETMFMANTVERYLDESDLSKKWAASFNGEIEAHTYAQEHYETAQLFAEMGIVVASVALLLKRKAAWLASLVLGAVAVFFVVSTWMKTSGAVSTAHAKIEELGDEYSKARVAHKTTSAEKNIVDAVKAWGGKSPAQNITGGGSEKAPEH